MTASPVPAPLPLLYLDEHYVAVDKPPGLLVHRTAIDRERDVLLQRLRDQLGHRVYPLHRLDRATSGVIVFGRDSEAAGQLAGEFRDDRVEKRYVALVRGWPPLEGAIERPLVNRDTGRTQSARTRFRRLATVELPIPVSRWPTARYALLQVALDTGRAHQIRRHLNGISHPVIGDVAHGDNRHNHLFRDRFGCGRLLLHAWRLGFRHPRTAREVRITAPLPDAFRALFEGFGWQDEAIALALAADWQS